MASISDVSLNWGLYYNLDNSGSDGVVTITTTTDLDGSNVFITLDGNNSESVTISDNSANITITDASFSALTSGTSYTINATIEGTDISNSESFTYDVIAPDPPDVTFPNSPNNNGDVTINSLGAGATTWEYSTNNGSNWTDGTGTNSFTLDEATYPAEYIQVRNTDDAGNVSSVTSNNGEIVIETSRPSMTITATEVASGATSNDATLSLTFTSSEDTSDFAEADITVTNGSLSAFTKSSDTVYTATFTPTANGNCTIRVAENTFNDAAGNGNTESAQFTWIFDNTAPDYDVTDPIGNFIFNISIPIANRLIENKSPTLVINTNEAGTLTTNIATGFNSGNSLSVSVGDNTIQLAELQYGTYSGKTLTLTDSANNSKTVTIPTFEVSAATLVVTSGIGIKRR